jgi:23S rRNA pseudouridine955/2504/2580 synthase
MYKFIRTKKIKVNGKRCEISQRLQLGDIVTMYINDDFFITIEDKQKPQLDLNSIPTELSIIYEDENLMVLDKPIGLVVHADNENSTDTLIGRVKKYLINSGQYDPIQENSFAPALCNRLDRNTSGLVICAKNAQALREINLMIKENRVHKKYLCLVISKPPKGNDTLIAYHHKSNQNNLVTIVDKPTPNFKQIVTKYRYLKSHRDLHLVEVELITGRTHQIRAHMAHIGCCLLGDNKYGNSKVNLKYKEKYQNLCAYSVSFSAHDGELLSYLDGKTFTTDNVPFVQKYGF